MKTGSQFRLSKTAKRMLATIIDPQRRGEWKRCLIDAESIAQIQPKGKNRQ